MADKKDDELKCEAKLILPVPKSFSLGRLTNHDYWKTTIASD